MMTQHTNSKRPAWPLVLVLIFVVCVGFYNRTRDDNIHAAENIEQAREDTSAPIPPTWLINLFSDVTTAVDYKYDMKDSAGFGMDCLHVYAASTPNVWGGHKYFAVYHFKNPATREYEVRLASSSNLKDWTFRRTLLNNADMPYIRRVGSGDSWIVLAHEQWQNPHSTHPSKIAFKLYYTEQHLAQGSYFNTFEAPFNSFSNRHKLEGTPTIYDVEAVLRGDLWMTQMNIGFHYNDDAQSDRVASAQLVDFGPTTVSPMYKAFAEHRYNNHFRVQGAIGNIGQRDSGTLKGFRFVLQEANIGRQPPTEFEKWRIWIYSFAPFEKYIPGGHGHISKLNVKTHKGSQGFGNPSFMELPCPDGNGQCVFVSYFIFSEGGQPGEPGQLGFWKRL